MKGHSKCRARQPVITGMSALTPIAPGEGLEAFWNGIETGTDTVGAISRFDTSDWYTDRGCEIRGFDVIDGHSPARCAEYARYTFEHAVDHAGLSTSGLERNRTALCVATILGGIEFGEIYVRGQSDAGALRGYCLDAPARFIDSRYGPFSQTVTITTACSSGLEAIGYACRQILKDRTDVAVVVGVEVLSEFIFSGFACLRAITTDRVRPFSKTRSGMAVGEGAAAVVIESRGHATARGATVWAEVAGFGSSLDARSASSPDGSGEGLALAVRRALESAATPPSDVDYLSAHGTATLHNDANEAMAIHKVFGDRSKTLPVSSMKSMLGHSMGAAGVIETVACVLAIDRETIPPTINYEEFDADCDIALVRGQALKTPIGNALLQNSGFGGQNCAVVLRRAAQEDVKR